MTTDISNILDKTADYDVLSTQLDISGGAQALCNAFRAGFSVKDISRYYSCTANAVYCYIDSLSDSDKNLIRHAQLEQHRQSERDVIDKMHEQASRLDSADDDTEAQLSVIVEKNVKTLNHVAAAHARVIARHENRLDKDTQQQAPQTTIIVSNEWLAALPDD